MTMAKDATPSINHLFLIHYDERGAWASYSWDESQKMMLRIKTQELLLQTERYSDKSLKNSVIDNKGILGNGVVFKILKCLSLLTKK